MSDDSRTPEQKAADENLNIAVIQAMQAYGEVQAGAVIAHYMVLVEQRAWTVSDEPVSGISVLLKDGTMPWPNILGTLRMATLQYENEWVRAS